MAQDIIHAEDGARGSLEGLSGPGPAVLSAPSLPPNYHRRAFDLSAVMQNQANSVYAAAQMNFPQQFQIPRAPMQMMPPSVIGGPSFVWANPQEGLYMPAYTGLPQNGVFGSVIAAAPAMDQRTAFDPSNELPVADRTAFQQPRSHGVVKINNVSIWHLMTTWPSVHSLPWNLKARTRPIWSWPTLFQIGLVTGSLEPRRGFPALDLPPT